MVPGALKRVPGSLRLCSRGPKGSSKGANARSREPEALFQGPFGQFQEVLGFRRSQGERIKHLKHRQLFNEHAPVAIYRIKRIVI